MFFKRVKERKCREIWNIAGIYGLAVYSKHRIFILQEPSVENGFPPAQSEVALNAEQLAVKINQQSSVSSGPIVDDIDLSVSEAVSVRFSTF